MPFSTWAGVQSQLTCCLDFSLTRLTIYGLLNCIFGVYFFSPLLLPKHRPPIFKLLKLAWFFSTSFQLHIVPKKKLFIKNLFIYNIYIHTPAQIDMNPVGLVIYVHPSPHDLCSPPYIHIHSSLLMAVLAPRGCVTNSKFVKCICIKHCQHPFQT